jgi:hypothetical protein
MSFSACLRQEGYVLIPRVSIFDRLQFARHQPIVYSIIRSMYNQFLSGGVRLIQKASDAILDDPFAKDIARGIEDWMWEALVQILMLGICVCSVFEGHTRTIEEYQIEQLKKAHKKGKGDEDEEDEVREVLIRKAQGKDYKSKTAKKRKRSEEEDTESEGEGDEDADRSNPEEEKANYYISRVMNIEELDVYVHMDIYNKTDYKFIYKNYAEGAIVELEILDLYVLEYEKPTVLMQQVQLNSLYNRIIQDYQLKEHNLLCHAQGTILSSNPMILLQDNPQKKDQDIAAADSIRDVFNTHVNTLVNASGSGGDPSKVQATKAVHPGYGYELMQAEQRLMESRVEERISRPQVILTPSIGAETQIGYLPYNRILAKQNLPIPVPYFLECSQMFQSQIYTALCIPMGIQNDINPTSKSKSSQSMGKGGTIGQDGTSTKSTSYELYNNTLRFIRNFLVREIQVILDLKTEASRTQMAQKISDTWNAKKRNRDSTPVQFDPGNLKISVEIPGLVNSEDVWALYKIDKLEESAFDGHFINNGFHARDLKEKAGLDVKEMNGISEAKEDTASKPAKKKKT